MNKSTVEQVLSRIREEAETSDAELRFVRTCQQGDEIRQGDVYLYPLGENIHPAGLAPASLQLAAGDGPGSRHIIEGNAAAYQRPQEDRSPLDGPLLHARERVTLTHPEHAHISLPAGWYEVRYQRDFSAPFAPIQRVYD